MSDANIQPAIEAVTLYMAQHTDECLSTDNSRLNQIFVGPGELGKLTLLRIPAC
jgi:hypothetical protein